MKIGVRILNPQIFAHVCGPQMQVVANHPIEASEHAGTPSSKVESGAHFCGYRAADGPSLAITASGSG